MKVGDKVTFPFANGQKEGIVHKINQKTVILKVDFPGHKGKLVRRKLSDLTKGGRAGKQKKASSS